MGNFALVTPLWGILYGLRGLIAPEPPSISYTGHYIPLRNTGDTKLHKDYLSCGAHTLCSVYIVILFSYKMSYILQSPSAKNVPVYGIHFTLRTFESSYEQN